LCLLPRRIVWALRYPETNELWLLDRRSDSAGSGTALDARSDRIHARSGELAGRPSIVLASEPMDGEAGWRLLDSGELVHVGPNLKVDARTPFPPQPSEPLAPGDLDPAAAASQHAHP
jgi:glutamine amidotransferase